MGTVYGLPAGQESLWIFILIFAIWKWKYTVGILKWIGFYIWFILFDRFFHKEDKHQEDNSWEGFDIPDKI